MIRYALATVCASLTLLVVSAVGKAQSCRTHGAVSYSSTGYHVPTYQAAVVKEIVVQKELVPIAVYVPAYQAVYTHQPMPAYQPPQQAAPQPQQQPNGDTQRILDAIGGVRSEVDGLRKRIEAVEAKQGGSLPPPRPDAPNPQPPAKPPDPFAPKGQASHTPDVKQQALGVYQNSCAQCHDASKAAEEGGDFILLVGGRKASLNDKERAKMVTKVQRRGTGQMPPASNKYHLAALTPQEIDIVKADNQ